MASTKGKLLDWLGSWALTSAEVRAVEHLSPSFVCLTLQAAPEVSGEPGDKIQIVLPVNGHRDGTTPRPRTWDHRSHCRTSSATNMGPLRP